MRRQRPGHRILSFHHRGLLLLAAAVAVMLFFLYGCMAGAAYSPRLKRLQVCQSVSSPEE